MRQSTYIIKDIIRFISQSKYNAQTEQIIKTLKLLKINYILKLQEIKIVL